MISYRKGKNGSGHKRIEEINLNSRRIEHGSGISGKGCGIVA